jgi:hypothetical protein
MNYIEVTASFDLLDFIYFILINFNQFRFYSFYFILINFDFIDFI